MTDPQEEIESVEEAVAQPEDSDVDHEEQREEEQEVQSAPSRGSVEYNWAESRRRMQELERMAREQADEIARLKTPPRVEEEDDLATLADDDIVTAAQARKLAQKMARQVAEEVVRKKDVESLDDRVKAKFPDYDQVVSMDNIELLKQQEPELALSIHAMASDPYAQAIAAYKLMKKLGLGIREEQRTMSKDKQKAIQNAKKPVPVQSVAKQSAIGMAHQFENGLTPELRKQLWAEMQAARKAG